MYDGLNMNSKTLYIQIHTIAITFKIQKKKTIQGFS